jgi:hypothetical protein
MPKIPVYENRAALSVGQPVRAGGWAEPFRQVEGQVARAGNVADSALGNMRAEGFHAGEQMRRGVAGLRQFSGGGDGLAAAGAALASAGGKIAEWAEEQNKQKMALDLVRRSTEMTKEFMDWYYPELEKSQGMNAEGFVERVKAKRGELAAKYSEGLEGEYAAKFHMAALQDYERDLKSAAGHQFSERQKTVEEQTQKLAQDAIAKSGFVTSPDQMDAILADVDVSFNMLHPGRDNRADIQALQTRVIDGAMRVAASSKNFAMAEGIKNRYGGAGIVDPGSVAAVNQIKDAAAREARADARAGAAEAREARAEARRQAGFAMFQMADDPNTTDDDLVAFGKQAGVDVGIVEHMINRRNTGATNDYDLQKAQAAFDAGKVTSADLAQFVAENNLSIRPRDQMALAKQWQSEESAFAKAQADGREDDVKRGKEIIGANDDQLAALAKDKRIDPVIRARVKSEATKKLLAGELTADTVDTWMWGQINKSGPSGKSPAEVKERLAQKTLLDRGSNFSEREWEKMIPDEPRRRSFEATVTALRAAQGASVPTPNDFAATQAMQADAPARPKDVPDGAVYTTYQKKTGGQGRAWFWTEKDGLKHRVVR